MRTYGPAPDMEPQSDGRGFAVAAGILGWSLDAFDFFVLIFVVDPIASSLGTSKAAIIATVALTLAMRPIGALLFGALADRYGRRKPMLGVIVFFTVIEIGSGLATNYPVFCLLRGLYGIGMGGFWGVGASLSLESSRIRLRGLFSGMLQSGYPLGYLLAAIAARLILPFWSWRVMFWCGVLPACVTLYIAFKAPESLAWKQNRVGGLPDLLRVVWQNRPSFAYLVVTLALMVCLAHGTQDLYPDFLKTMHQFSPRTAANLAIIYSIGGIGGTVAGGHLSEWLGRRRSIIIALVICLLIIPGWAFGESAISLTISAIIMQIGVQAAWGVIPAHLNELSPGSARSLFSGLVYQLGVLCASPTNSIEYFLRGRIGYEWALSVFEGVALILLIGLFALGPERKGDSFVLRLSPEEAILE